MQRKAKILFLDDEAGVREGLVELYAIYGNETRGAANDVEAEREFITFQPDVVVIDITLPEGSKDGIEVLKKLREQNGQFEAIIYSSSPASNYVHRINEMQSLNVFESLTKPIEPEKLKETITRATERFRTKNGE